jgi:hydroxymethylglutaryl-CoA reductase
VNDSRIGGLYRLSVPERIDELQRRGWLGAVEAEQLRQGRSTLLPASADKMVENVLGVFGLPFAVAPNFIINGRDYIVPMVVEEPSVVAATSGAAMMARPTGGFTTSCDESLLIGQIHVCDVDDCGAAVEMLTDARDELLELCDIVHPRLVKRGGGVRDIEHHVLRLPNGDAALAVHVLVDTQDAMGANLVNTICEAIAPRVAELCGGHVALRILSNLADRSVVTARVRYELDDDVRDGVVRASDIASVDPYRAVTHNKGIMNGIDAVAIATGNDWRAIEAGAHAYAVRDGSYGPLATWSVGDDGTLVGEINVPLKVGTVGGNLDANVGAALGLGISGVANATELAGLMAAVGLAQNFAALRALATSGIQEGHMKLHARSVASSAGVPDELFDDVVADLISDGEIKVWKARQLVEQRIRTDVADVPDGAAAGKVLLLGEHAVVYGKHALALPIPNAVTVMLRDEPTDLALPELEDTIALIKDRLGVEDSPYSAEVTSRLPLAMGLGASAAYAVAITRAFNLKHGVGLDDTAINEIAFECEKLAHGTPSGVDNTVATYGAPILFSNDGSLKTQRLSMSELPPLVIACSHQSGRTKEQVANVRERHGHNPSQYDAIFAQVDALSLAGADAMRGGDYEELGRLMNICHGLLTAIEVSTPELEGMVSLARAAGAVGAKMTGGGGGGSIVALCPGRTAEVRDALKSGGYYVLDLN